MWAWHSITVSREQLTRYPHTGKSLAVERPPLHPSLLGAPPTSQVPCKLGMLLPDHTEPEAQGALWATSTAPPYPPAPVSEKPWPHPRPLVCGARSALGGSSCWPHGAGEPGPGGSTGSRSSPRSLKDASLDLALPHGTGWTQTATVTRGTKQAESPEPGRQEAKVRRAN